MQKRVTEFGPVFWVHLLILIPAYLSPFWLDWRVILFAIILLQIDYAVSGGCFLTHLEMGKDKNLTFVWHYLRKVFPGLDQTKTKFVIRVIVPGILFLSSFISQWGFGFVPYIKFSF